jgi:hypothetical protein
MQKHITILLLLFSITNSSFAQATDPTPFDLSSADFALAAYTGTTFPANIAIGFETNTTDGSFVSDLASDVATNGTAAGNWNDEAVDGISYRGDNAGQRGSFLLALNATNRSNIIVSWTVRDINVQANTNYIELQWRSGTSGSFTDVTGDLYQQGTSPNGQTYSVTLPAAANNLTDLNIRWIYYEVGTGSRSRLAIDDITVSSALPVTWVSFSAEARGTDAALKFSTATEVNNHHFDIERSTDGTNFEQIGTIQVIGTSFATQTYTYEDHAPGAGIYYYRIKQEDTDGQSSYSPVRLVKFKYFISVTVQPTQVTDQVIIRLDEPFPTDTPWTITDMSGRIIHAGLIESEQIEQFVSTNTWSQGTYVLTMQNPLVGTISKRLIK